MTATTQPTPATPPIRIGLIGLGVISKFYVAALEQLPSLDLAAVCDLRPEALEPFRAGTKCYTSHTEMLADAGVDAVVVNVPNDVHASVCGDAMEAGLPVCVEKPLATTLVDGRALAELAHVRRVPLFTSFHRRYNSEVLRLLEELRTTHAANPVRALTVRYLERIEEHAGSDRWYLDTRRCGGGCVADNGPNAFDLVRQYLGDVELTGAQVTRDEHGTDREAIVRLRTPDGIPARVELDWSYDGEVKDVTVELADGQRLVADMLKGHLEFKGSLWHEYVGVLQDFETRLRAGAESTRGGLAALNLVDAVYRSEGVAT
ncbi:Gfo/Idh/MocA family oxidoreductase [Streptomyces sp. N2-109]|uniref:Gfo/Idh/MocA family oxidoreductase n=1 Tax=Streptomyces gossypii TaxID=2883101 RepID=A0ABT2JPA5_9ACTN|nr:Gfo/Idh/MocA family oxidoreductase [Streptomyces gossypii]MCT2589571.1 Gfo/Idh/MocA family oxidoreductase [Streptomyces gossypii]